MDDPGSLRECLRPTGARCVGRKLNAAPYAHAGWKPPIDIYETDAEVVIHADIPGLDPESLIITVFENKVLITGEVPPGSETVSRIIALPTVVRSAPVGLTVDGGVVEIRMSKAVPACQ